MVERFMAVELRLEAHLGGTTAMSLGVSLAIANAALT